MIGYGAYGDVFLYTRNEEKYTDYLREKSGGQIDEIEDEDLRKALGQMETEFPARIAVKKSRPQK